jgi:predicted nuclease of predicted toxin-antitoxin system
MPEPGLRLLLDQNIPQACAVWLRQERPGWTVWHTNETGLEGRPDAEIFRWAQERSAVVISYDEDFADARSFPLGAHHGVIRLRVWPTTIEATVAALQRVLAQLAEADLPRNLIIVDNQRIRLRRAPAPPA